MKIFIDNLEADIDENTNVSITLSVASLMQLEKSRTGYSKTIVLPMTSRNKGIIGDCEQINSISMFNQTAHTARIEKDGCTVIEGTPFLTECVNEGGAGSYHINIIGPGKQWVKLAAETPLRSLGLEFKETLNATMIRNSWTWNKPVRFLPVQRECFEAKNHNSNIIQPQKILTYEDYHPFLHVKSMVDKVFSDAGYSINSEFMSGALFRSLYMSGNYPTKDTALIKSRMDFKAGRNTEKQAVADHLGRVYATPYSNINTIGNIVETADPRDSNGGETADGVFTVGDYFKKDGEHIVFTPPSEVMVGFEYSFSFTTGYKIISPTQLQGFSSVYLGEGTERTFTLSMPFEDRRDQIRGNKTFKIIVFDHTIGDRYRFTYWEITNPNANVNDLKTGDYVVRNFDFTTRSTSMTLTTSNLLVNATLMIKYSGFSSYRAIKKEWAIFDGSVEEIGTMDVELNVRTKAEKVSPSRPKTFYDIYFGGAGPGMSFKIGKKTTLKPLFVYHPTEGSSIDFETVAAQNISCLEMINGFKQMFNLYFFTDQITRTVYVEPRKDFYQNSPIIDLSDKIDHSRPIVISELGGDLHKKLTFCYKAGDIDVSTFNRENGDQLGTWRAEINTLQAKDGEKVYENPVFAPIISKKGGYLNALSALLLQVGSGSDEDDSGGINFSPRIVRYLGTRSLPGAETWGWPGNTNAFPLAAFHYHGDNNSYRGSQPNPLSTYSGDSATLAANGLSLCFEDRDGVAGIHRYWDGNISLFNQSKRLELYVMLGPEEIEPLISLNVLRRDFRALYRIKLGGESALFRLEQICDYSPASRRPTKCLFIKEI